MWRIAKRLALLTWLPLVGLAYSLKGTSGYGNGGVTALETVVLFAVPVVLSMFWLRKDTLRDSIIVPAQLVAFLITIKLYEASHCIAAYEVFVEDLDAPCTVAIPWTGLGVWSCILLASAYAAAARTELSVRPTIKGARAIVFILGCVAVAAIFFALDAYAGASRRARTVCDGLADGVNGHGVVYSKSEHVLFVMRRGEIVFSAVASHGRGVGAKQCEGDQRTPEGTYRLSPARDSASFGRFMAVSYPNDEDRARSKGRGCEPGGGIGVHGPQRWYEWLGTAHALVNHSDGCIVLDNESMERLDKVITEPMPLTILP